MFSDEVITPGRTNSYQSKITTHFTFSDELTVTEIRIITEPTITGKN